MRLRRSDLSAEGITRRRHGKGFAYHLNGSRVTDPETLRRIQTLVIPPAWTQVWISADPRGHIQAVGFDAAGRKQYRYHDQWRTSRDAAKFAHMLDFAKALPRLRRRVRADLSQRGLRRERVLAVAAALLDSAALRVGGESYAQDDPVLGDATFGLATLRRDHVAARGDRVRLAFPGKGTVTVEVEVADPAIADVVRNLLRRNDPSPELLAYHAGGRWHDVRSDHVNAYLREVTAMPVSAKDFRTWHGTVAAAVSLAGALAQRPAGKTARNRAVAQAMRDTAELLGNTPAVARKSYVDPNVVELFLRDTVVGVTAADFTDRRSWLRAENAVRKLLEAK